MRHFFDQPPLSPYPTFDQNIVILCRLFLYLKLNKTHTGKKTKNNAFVRISDLVAMFHLLLLTISTHMVVECWAQDSTDKIKTNLAAGPDSIHSHYQPLFEKGEGSSSDKEESVGGKAAEKKIEIVNRVSIPESESTRLIFSVASLLLDTAWKVSR